MRDHGRRRRLALSMCVAVVVAASGGTTARADAPVLKIHAPTLRVGGQAARVDAVRLAVDAPVLAITGNPLPPHKAQPFRKWIVYFGFRKAVPVDPNRVRRVADAIEQLPAVDGLRIDGFTDVIGKRPYNKRLSGRRACAVARELTRLLAPTVPPLQVRAFGKSHFAARNTRPDGSDDPVGRARNRRVRVKVLKSPPHSGIICERRR